jgi:hypothetical protein
MPRHGRKKTGLCGAPRSCAPAPARCAGACLRNYRSSATPPIPLRMNRSTAHTRIGCAQAPRLREADAGDVALSGGITEWGPAAFTRRRRGFGDTALAVNPPSCAALLRAEIANGHLLLQTGPPARGNSYSRGPPPPCSRPVFRRG